MAVVVSISGIKFHRRALSMPIASFSVPFILVTVFSVYNTFVVDTLFVDDFVNGSIFIRRHEVSLGGSNMKAFTTLW